MKSLSHVQFFTTPRTVAYQAPPSMVFSRQEYWSGLPFPFQTPAYYTLITEKSFEIADGWKLTLPEPSQGLGLQLALDAGQVLQTDSVPSEPPGKPYLKILATPIEILVIPIIISNFILISYFYHSLPNLLIYIKNDNFFKFNN